MSLHADQILINGNIYTIDPANPKAEAMAVKDGKILHIGSNDEIRNMANSGTAIIDAQGKTVFPGFQDTHMHLQDSGAEMAWNADLNDVESVADIQKALSDHAKTTDDLWVCGTGFNPGSITTKHLSKEDLDKAVPDRPVFIFAADYHNAVMNTKGFETLGITPDTPDPENGHIVKNEDGSIQGWLFEDAIWWAKKQQPKVEDDYWERAVEVGAAHCNAHGITAVLDAMVADRHLRVYHKLEQEGRLNVRVRSTSKIFDRESVEDAVNRLKGYRAQYDSDMLSLHSAKFFLDGVFENKTAMLLEPDTEGDNAELMFNKDHLMDLMVAFDKEKFQLHLHVIGDGATRVALDGIEKAIQENGKWDSLHQLAHLQLVDPADIPRFGELGAVANMQPLWAIPEESITEMAQPWLGPERSKWIYPTKSLVESGSYAISSDWGVSTLNPFEIMQVACTRAFDRDSEALLPEQCLTVDQVIKGYTIHAAECAWRADKTGTLEKGKYADYIIIDHDPYETDLFELAKIKVDLTILEGREVYRKEGFNG
ncbi:amidohydrolase [Curvivirga sp.]|uniref:amidohydrolase n=1 Tax=Curvivirga sp. TaxID=2856848 RepID=UPI003B5A69A6